MKHYPHLRVGFYPKLFVLFLWVFLFPPLSSGEEPFNREYTLKASYLLKITNFVVWPNKNKKELTLCIKGENPFGTLFQQAKNEGVIETSLVVIPSVSPAGLSECNILFISSSEKNNLANILSLVDKFHILVFGDTPGFAQNGVGINLVVVKNKIQIEVNRKALRRSKIYLSSEVLNLANVIVGGEINEFAKKSSD